MKEFLRKSLGDDTFERTETLQSPKDVAINFILLLIYYLIVY